MIILGIDPGFAITGYGFLKMEGNKFKPLDYGVITTTPQMLFSDRLLHIGDELGRLIDTYHPDVMSIEELFFNNNAKTAIQAAQGRGVAVYEAARRHIPVHEFTPLQVKQSVTGYGRADKKQIQQMVKVLLNLEKIPKPDDAADALAIAICYGNSAKFSQRT